MVRGRSWGVVGVVVVVAAAIGYVAFAASRDQNAGDVPPGCRVSLDGATFTMSPEQASHATTIAAVGKRLGMPDHAVSVALATALQESKLENLDGGDRDSLGLFQQRPSQGWGTPEQVQDPRYAAKKFYNALLKVKGWQKMRVTDAAQRVQRSAYPNAYEKWADEAQAMADALLGKVSAAVVCTLPEPGSTDVQTRQDGQTAVTALAESMTLDYGNDLTMSTDPSEGAVSVAASGPLGWAYAHWLVSRAADRGVAKVTYAGREWTAQTGKWQDVPSNDASQVVASVV